MADRRVIHLGPSDSRGGMASVISNLVANPPSGWNAMAISTHSDGKIYSKTKAFFLAGRELRRFIRDSSIDVAHFHVTHSISWWRKRMLMWMCEKAGVPSVVHIHSGRFDDFCKGIAGKSVFRALRIRPRKTVVLEERWRRILSQWIPSDTEVVYNASGKVVERGSHDIESRVRLLMMSRDSRGKGHEFAVRVLESLHEKGFDAILNMTGVTSVLSSSLPDKCVRALGWVSDEKKKSLMLESDILLMPSEFEGSSMAVIESIVCGLPCLASPANAETIGVPSLVLSLENPSIWAERVMEIVQPEVYANVVNDLKKQSERFSIVRAQERLGILYEELLREGNLANINN